MRIFFVFCHTCLLVKASYLSHADTLRTRIHNYQKICDTQFLKKSENDRILKAVNSSNDQNKVSKAKLSNIRSVIDNYHNPDGKYNHKSFKRKISFCLPPETGTHAWSYFMMAIQKNISLYEVYEDYRAEKMGKRFFKMMLNYETILEYLTLPQQIDSNQIYRTIAEQLFDDPKYDSVRLIVSRHPLARLHNTWKDKFTYWETHNKTNLYNLHHNRNLPKLYWSPIWNKMKQYENRESRKALKVSEMVSFQAFLNYITTGDNVMENDIWTPVHIDF